MPKSPCDDESSPPPPRVAGVDGCRSGWVLATLAGDREPDISVVPDFNAVLDLVSDAAVLGVDAPIGLPERYERGGRACDREARSLLGRVRGASVFPAPARAVLDAVDHGDATARNLDASGDPVGVTLQTFNIVPKLREVDRALERRDRPRVLEVHPELSFMELAGEPLVEPKRSREGRERRIALLEGALSCDVRALVEGLGGCAKDDVVDALVVCWSADRIARGQGVPVPSDAPEDAKGLAMQIWR